MATVPDDSRDGAEPLLKDRSGQRATRQPPPDLGPTGFAQADFPFHSTVRLRHHFAPARTPGSSRPGQHEGLEHGGSRKAHCVTAPIDYAARYRDLRRTAGLQDDITDPVTLEKVATILRAVRPKRVKRRAAA